MTYWKETQLKSELDNVWSMLKAERAEVQRLREEVKRLQEKVVDLGDELRLVRERCE